MQLKQLDVFDNSTNYAIGYEDEVDFCTEVLSEKQINEIITNYGEEEIKRIKICDFVSVVIFLDKELYYRINREVIEELKETA